MPKTSINFDRNTSSDGMELSVSVMMFYYEAYNQCTKTYIGKISFSAARLVYSNMAIFLHVVQYLFSYGKRTVYGGGI